MEVAIKNSIARELAHTILINQNLPKRKSYSVKPIKAYFGTQNRHNLMTGNNFIVMEWVNGYNMEEVESNPETVLSGKRKVDYERIKLSCDEIIKDIFIAVKKSGIGKRNLDDIFSNVFFRGVNRNGKPIFSVYDQYCPFEVGLR